MKIVPFAFSSLSFVLALFATVPSSAEELKVGADARKDLSIAIYNSDLALVKDKRNISLKTGVNDIAFVDVSAQIQPETVLVFGDKITVLEQNFDYDLLTPQALLNKYVGKEIKLITANPATGVEKTETAKVLSTAEGNVLQIGDRIETNVRGRFVFPNIPDNLRDKPTLVLKLNTPLNAKNDIEIAYLTRGLSWQANYVAKLNNTEDTVALNGWVTLNNTSGVSYENTLLQLVAGNVNRVAPMLRRNFMAKTAMMADNMAVAENVSEESFMDYHLYTVAGKTSILSNQTKQISLLSSPTVAVTKEYKLENIVPFSANPKNAETKYNPSVLLNIKNEEKVGLGLPLPAGVFRVYKEDSSKKLLFVGEDRITHIQKNGDFKVKLGEAFDVSAKVNVTDFKKMGNRAFESSFEVSFLNSKDIDVVVNLYQNFPSNFKLVSENIKSSKEGANRLLWKVLVPKNSSAVLKAQIFVAD